MYTYSEPALVFISILFVGGFAYYTLFAMWILLKMIFPRRWWNRRKVKTAKAYLEVYSERRCASEGSHTPEWQHWHEMEQKQVNRISDLT
jgi:hypothetical protein